MQSTLQAGIYNGEKIIKGLQETATSGVVGAIKAAASRTGVDFAYLLNKASQESGMNPLAKASSSSATGLYQFIKQTWLQMVKQHGAQYGLGAEADSIQMKNGQAVVTDKAMRDKILNMRHDPVLSAAMAAEFTKDNKDYLEASVGGNVGSTELYLAHFLGAGGASTFLKAMRTSPNAPAAELLPEAANANQSVFYNKSGRELSLKEIYDRFASKFSNKGLNSLVADAQNEAATNSVVYQAAPQMQSGRDLAEYSADFYSAPSPEMAQWQQNNTTSDTLFNVMLMAQNSMNESLINFTGQHKDDRKLGALGG